MSDKVRKIRNTGCPEKVIGKSASTKSNSMISWESMLERDYAVHLELDPEVIFFESQPLKLTFFVGGRSRTYTPDFSVNRGEKIIVEVKPEAMLNKDRNMEILEFAPGACKEIGLGFELVTDILIRKEPRLSNLKLLARYKRTPTNSLQIGACKHYFDKVSATSIFNLRNRLSSVGISVPVVLSLVIQGLLVIDLDKPLSLESIIRLSKGRNCLGGISRGQVSALSGTSVRSC